MTEALALAAAIMAGVDGRLLVLLSGAVWAPWPTAILVLVAVALERRRSPASGDEPSEAHIRPDEHVRFLEVVVGELRAGASLRAALSVACGQGPRYRSVRRRLDVGAPLVLCATELRQALPAIGELVEAAVVAGAEGGRMLPAFEEIIVHATAQEAAAAELRAATVQVRASLALLVGGPVTYLVWAAATGRLLELLSHPVGAAAAAIGTVLFVAGVLAMAVMARSRPW